MLKQIHLLLISALFIPLPGMAQKKTLPELPVYAGKDGKLRYTPDSLGNRIPDFSYAGYHAGERAIPVAEVKVVVPLRSGDATNAIQSALDYIAALKPGKDGLRGAVLLQAGTYTIEGSLLIKASGVVLRGSGATENGTTILGAGTDRSTLIRVAGKDDQLSQKETKIDQSYVPVNALTFKIAGNGDYKVGDHISIRRPSTAEWIKMIGADHFGGGVTALGWKPGQRDIIWDRTITAVQDNNITIDAPLTTALDQKYGGGFISSYTWKGRIAEVGIENLNLVSAYDKSNPKDEAHRWMAITMENVKDAWVRQINFKHFAGSAVAVFASGRRITVEDCKSLDPVSEIGGQRRNTFYTAGQQTLFQRLYSAYGYHDFATGFCAAGPNAFVECKAFMPFSFSGATDSWASGVLFDIINIDGQAALSFMNRGQDGMGAGWAAANSVFWQCSASRIDCFMPPTAQNWAFGNWAQFSGNGFWDSSNELIKPRSLYYAQLGDRLNKDISASVFVMPTPTEASSSPSVAVADELTRISVSPAMLLEDFIDQAPQRTPIAVKTGAKTIDQIGITGPKPMTPGQPMNVQNGWLVRGNAILAGARQEVQWWTGSARPHGLKNAKFHITRFVPGQTGKGLTDDLNAVTDRMKVKGTLAIDHNYALWYERRRDDHERIRRIDGDVWPPFYELPFARSGVGTAYDGLSKYDLTKYNKWYWSRLKQFADLADQKGLVLMHQNYFQHNIIEAGAHYADFPWRPANNVNNTGFPEPVPYAGDKRVFMAAQFYDISKPELRRLHAAYIRQCLENFKDNSGVIQLISAEFTGPLHFVQFWIDTIKEWEKETGRHPQVALSTTKDVQDAILADPERASVVDIIDIRYWHYQADGKTYAPAGGQNLAPRQQARLLKPKKTDFQQVFRAVNEYRQKYPQKAVTYSGDNYDRLGWAVLMGGGSMPVLPPGADQSLLQAAKDMAPSQGPEGQYLLANDGKSYLLYLEPGKSTTLSVSPGTYTTSILDPSTGELAGKAETRKLNSTFQYQNSSNASQLVWIIKK